MLGISDYEALTGGHAARERLRDYRIEARKVELPNPTQRQEIEASRALRIAELENLGWSGRYRRSRYLSSELLYEDEKSEDDGSATPEESS